MKEYLVFQLYAPLASWGKKRLARFATQLRFPRALRYWVCLPQR